MFRKNHEEYCKKLNYDYVALDTHPLEKEIPPYWLKVFLVKEYLQKYDIVMWMDSDAEFYNTHIWIDVCIGNNKFIISEDKPQHRFPALLNTGVFIVRKSGEYIIDDWIKCFELSKSRWNYVNNKWICLDTYSGTSYEQGALIQMYKSGKYEIYKRPWKSLNNHNTKMKGFVNHFCGSFGRKHIKYHLY